MEEVRRSIVISSIVSFLVLLLAGNYGLVWALGMTSSTYKIQDDSINFGGGRGNSTTYTLESTLGEVATGDSNSASYKLHAGYQQMNTVYLAMTAAANVTMSPSLAGVTGGTANGSAVTTVTTDDAAGYELYYKASSSPAMKGNTSGDSIANYVPTTSDPDFTFSVPSSAAEFGFTPEGTDIANKYRDNGSTCNTGTNDTADACWNAVPTTNELIAKRTSANTPSGTATTLKFRITIGSSGFKLEDTYTATTTITALAQ